MNTEDSYETFYHLEGIAIEDILSVKIIGDALISYTGFGDKGKYSTEIQIKKNVDFYLDLKPAPPIGFNITFMCAEGKVFSHDWFSTPFVMMTCQVKHYFT